MPTYSFKCQACGAEYEVARSIREHVANPSPFACCGAACERWFPPTGGRAILDAMVSDRHYAGLRASDGTDISTRAKHREYMRRNNLTTIDDYKESWAKAQAEREAYRQGLRGGAITRNEIAESVYRTPDLPDMAAWLARLSDKEK